MSALADIASELAREPLIMLALAAAGVLLFALLFAHASRPAPRPPPILPVAPTQEELVAKSLERLTAMLDSVALRVELARRRRRGTEFWYSATGKKLHARPHDQGQTALVVEDPTVAWLAEHRPDVFCSKCSAPPR